MTECRGKWQFDILWRLVGCTLKTIHSHPIMLHFVQYSCYDYSPADQVGDECKDSSQCSSRGEHHCCSVRRLGHYRDRKKRIIMSPYFRMLNQWCVNMHRRWEQLTRCIPGLVDGDSSGGQGHAAGVLQGDVDTVGARLLKCPPETHLTLCRRWDILAHNGAHLSTAGVWHDGAGWSGDADDEAWKTLNVPEH